MTKFTSINFDDFWATPEKEVQVWSRRRGYSCVGVAEGVAGTNNGRERERREIQNQQKCYYLLATG